MNKKHFLATALACAALGINAPAAKEKDSAGSSKGGGMTMMDMMGQSNMSCMATHDSLESLSKTIQEALKSDDKAKMKSALQQADAHFAQMKNHMSKCMDMMNMMGGMMGGGMMGGKSGQGMGMGGKPQGDAKPATPDNDAAEHEKHHPK
jgi:hypothetical protein